ncbi:transporter [Schlesneria paludicola]|uniref:transporter n=1 Tax=Schlesneria paludicola TaxID=360056 RepID=UPI00029AA0BC|nr:transporter [Schlesneria paludicola]
MPTLFVVIRSFQIGMIVIAFVILTGIAHSADQDFPSFAMSSSPVIQDVQYNLISTPGYSDKVSSYASGEGASGAEKPIRYFPDGNGQIVISDPADFPRIRVLDYHQPGSLWDNMRPNLFGQEVPDEWDFYNLVNTDRPDFTDAAYSVGKGVTVIESGYTFRQTSADDLHLTRRQLPEVLTRIGITDELEFRIKWNGYVMTDISDVSTNLKTSTFGGDDLQLGFKYELLQQDDWRPMLTFVGGAALPTGTGGISANAVQPSANLVVGWGFRRWLYLKASTGVDFVKSRDATRIIDGSLQEGPLAVLGEDSSSQWHQSASLLIQATKRVGAFVEWFAFFSNNASDNRASNFGDMGVFIYLTPNVQLDARIGERLGGDINTLFTGSGLSIRF